ncbi:hypothetical protein BFP97_03420 [Roseivirga sp. 4D4]|uniref:pepsin-like aspartic protease n=1 Tax=Roseivirga sp. 4D4 TaxID=1889784 RepID=UPI0008529C04|nr:pepsin-like aspartic protease [Roseivirga sp. 4D4]OEK00611.1 hypothetical protein BFP97_03420 [Roseivirga sp. 4D4]
MRNLYTLSGLCCFIFLCIGCTSTKNNETQEDYGIIKISYQKGPYQNNGASPWYAELAMGTPPQPLKFGMDTGNNADWVTTVQCNTPACTQPGRHRFDMYESTSFQWISQNPDTLSFGPWGQMLVNTGSDYIDVNGVPVKSKTSTYLSLNYDGSKFEELNWDGGIGFPSQDEDANTDFFLEQMLNQGLIDPDNILVSFYTNPTTGQGEIMIGGYDESLVISESKLTFPFVPYELSGGALEYLWTAPIDNFTVGNTPVAIDKTFCFDTGSSEFKGDTTIMNNSLTAIQAYYNQYEVYPEVKMSMGQNNDGETGLLVIGPDQYRTEIEAGEGQGTIVTAFTPLEIQDMILVGSVLLDYVYPVFKYEAEGSPGDYQVKPVETWLFNKVDGPIIIQN